MTEMKIRDWCVRNEFIPVPADCQADGLVRRTGFGVETLRFSIDGQFVRYAHFNKDMGFEFELTVPHCKVAQVGSALVIRYGGKRFTLEARRW